MEERVDGAHKTYGDNDITIQDLKYLFDKKQDFSGISNPLFNSKDDAKNPNPYQGRLRYGDFNQDGFPDLLITL